MCERSNTDSINRISDCHTRKVNFPKERLFADSGDFVTIYITTNINVTIGAVADAYDGTGFTIFIYLISKTLA
jgi:hypothetical protein